MSCATRTRLILHKIVDEMKTYLTRSDIPSWRGMEPLTSDIRHYLILVDVA